MVNKTVKQVITYLMVIIGVIMIGMVMVQAYTYVSMGTSRIYKYPTINVTAGYMTDIACVSLYQGVTNYTFEYKNTTSEWKRLYTNNYGLGKLPLATFNDGDILDLRCKIVYDNNSFGVTPLYEWKYAINQHSNETNGINNGTGYNMEYDKDKGARFNGASSWINHTVSSFDGDSTYGASFWFQYHDINPQNIYSEVDGTTSHNVYVDVVSDKLRMINGYDVCTGITTLEQNKWYHGIITRNGNNQTIYLNGQIECEDNPTITSLSTVTEIIIGEFATQYANISLLNLKTYSESIELNEAVAIYNEGGEEIVSLGSVYVNNSDFYFKIYNSGNKRRLVSGSVESFMFVMNTGVQGTNVTGSYVDCGGDSVIEYAWEQNAEFVQEAFYCPILPTGSVVTVGVFLDKDTGSYPIGQCVNVDNYCLIEKEFNYDVY